MIKTPLVESSPRSTPPKSETLAWRIQFGPVAPVGADVLQHFFDPEEAFAWVRTLDASEAAKPAATDHQLDVIAYASESPDAVPVAQSNAPLPIAFALGRGRLTWTPGTIVVEQAALRREELVALAEFAFYETQLRGLEEAIRPYEISAMTDAAHAYRPSSAATEDWNRFGQFMESLALLRLKFARLEPRLLIPSRALPPASRRLIRQLSRRTQIEDRLEAVTNRLEACEDLYEGAVDRITDHRWYRKGNLLEMIIVVLLLIEVLQLGGETAIRFIHDHLH